MLREKMTSIIGSGITDCGQYLRKFGHYDTMTTVNIIQRILDEIRETEPGKKHRILERLNAAIHFISSAQHEPGMAEWRCENFMICVSAIASFQKKYPQHYSEIKDGADVQTLIHDLLNKSLLVRDCFKADQTEDIPEETLQSLKLFFRAVDNYLSEKYPQQTGCFG